MSASTFIRSRRTWRWGVPVAAVAVIGLVGSGVLSAGATPNLPSMAAPQLLAAVEQSNVDGFAGQIVENASLGLPQLPDFGGAAPSSSLASLLSGSHTARVWYAGPTKQRFAMLTTLGETDIFHDGTNLWEWDSSTLTAEHIVLPDGAAPNISTPVERSTLTPQELAQRAISAIDPSTVVTTDQSRRIAGRDAYDLVLTPRDTTSRVGSVRIGIDSQYKIPLSVQVFARGDATNAAIDVSFTSIDFSVPSDSQFSFTPPKSATVKEQKWDAVLNGDHSSTAGHLESAAARAVRVLGKGWTSVIELPSAGSSTDSLLGALTAVSGTWGSGRLFNSKLLTALFVSDGRVYAGAVDPSVLYAAAAHK